MTNTNVKVILNIFILKLSNINVLFANQELTWRLYILDKVLSMTKQI